MQMAFLQICENIRRCQRRQHRADSIETTFENVLEMLLQVDVYVEDTIQQGQQSALFNHDTGDNTDHLSNLKALKNF